MASRKILGIDLPEPERNGRRSHPAFESSQPPGPAKLPPPPQRAPKPPYERNLSPGPFELSIKDESQRPPPPAYRSHAQPPPTEQAPAPTIVVQGHGLKVTIPAALLLAAATALGTTLLSPSSGSSAKLERIEDRQARAEKDAERARVENDRAVGQLIQRLDRIESQLSLLDARLDDMRRRLRSQKEEP